MVLVIVAVGSQSQYAWGIFVLCAAVYGSLVAILVAVPKVSSGQEYEEPSIVSL